MLEITLPECFSICFFNSSRENKVKVPLITKLNPSKVEDISSIKNTEVADAEFVKVYDTSSRIPQTTLLIDTPGLSSSDPRHKQALVSFLPEADGILLVMDINAQLNRSTIDFIGTISLSNRPVYLILTKCDTKTGEQALNSIKYIEEAHQLPL